VAITLPKPITDPAFDALRRQLAEVAERKDRAALAKLVITLGFFWDRENGDGADKHKSAIDNLAAALGLDNKEGNGWGILATFAENPTASSSPDHKSTMCSPADPGYNSKDLDALIDATDTNPSDWGYPISPGVEVRAAGDNGAPVIDKLGLYFVRVLPDSVSAAAAARRNDGSANVARDPYRSFIARITDSGASVAAFEPISGQSPMASP
jgi:hypothetical protein